MITVLLATLKCQFGDSVIYIIPTHALDFMALKPDSGN